jgi:DNA-binding NarL/FixJ family response regulator
MSHKVILADNQSVFRAGVARLLSLEDSFRIVGQCEDLNKLTGLLKTSSNNIVLVASSMQPAFGPLAKLVSSAGGRTIAVLENDEIPDAFLREGVNGTVHRDVASAELVQCVKSIALGRTHVQQRAGDDNESIEADAVAQRVCSRLTNKELKVLGLILQGYKNRDIAEELGNSEQVIKNYLRRIFDKTGNSDRLGLAVFAMNHKKLAWAATDACATQQAGFLGNQLSVN